MGISVPILQNTDIFLTLVSASQKPCYNNAYTVIKLKKVMHYFWNKIIGIIGCADRPCAKEYELLGKIASLMDKNDPISIASLRVYHRFLTQLRQIKNVNQQHEKVK
jgi:hypothetical protein